MPTETGVWKPRADPSSLEALPPTNMQSYYYWFLVNSTSKQKTIMKYALGRLAREYPDKDPREILLEFFADSIYLFERHMLNLKKGELLCRKETLEDLES